MPRSSPHERTLSEQLRNPVWHALQGPQRCYAISTPQAARFHPDFASQAALGQGTPQAWDQLRTLTGAQESVDLFHDEPLKIGEGWERRFEVPLVQMVLKSSPEVNSPRPGVRIEALGVPQVPAMLQLVALTRPGPFRSRTVELGQYLGVWQEETLIAMAGQRVRLEGAGEISGVCTHPDFRRRGLALALVSRLARDMQAAGVLPFLHVNAQNTAAIAAYTALGFRVSREIRVSVVRPLAHHQNPREHS
ncbi:GNAT family N-acetyltransferase [Deinococcus peraridilitoris]|uniref:Putative acyltransferase n=1 Tax=Deinococcus peraridilitoris (strain DSM 19664 / LMG 22246 / CIP 109416 / KR-200) TaxID=937777 RepID=L0A0B0_DEIPD|nr:GNAT family N-acetyltransferase [Deinococcus peraridilitoris]AFZ67328.1 putative acyltransferase [Deinococcus peraridilitoris DSM 19664]